MSYFRILYLAITAGIGGYIYKSNRFKQNRDNYLNNYLRKLHSASAAENRNYFYQFNTEKWQNKFFKVNAQPSCEESQCDQDCDEEEAEDEEEEEEEVCKSDVKEEEKSNVEEPDCSIIEISEVIPASPNAECPRILPGYAIEYPHPVFPTRTILHFKENFIIFADSRTKTPCWSVEAITKGNVAQAEHQHCEIARIICCMPQSYEFGQRDYTKKLEILSLITAKTYSTEDQKLYCYYCDFSPFRKVFHRYVTFLLGKYDEVFVCSGLLYLDKETQEPRKASHYFKAIVCKNADNTYRLECYKICNQENQNQNQIVSLRDHLVSRGELERNTGFTIFNSVAECDVANSETHCEFTDDIANALSKIVIEEGDEEEKPQYESPLPFCRVNCPDELFGWGNQYTARITEHPTIASRNIMRFWDYVIYGDAQTRTRWWTHQTISCSNMEDVEHRHCERTSLIYNQCAADDNLDVTCVLPPAQPCLDACYNLVCSHCQFQTFWNVFHQYITFLVGQYGLVFVCSGLLFSPNDDFVEDKSKRKPTHYFKAIRCFNPDGTSRIECYVVPCTSMKKQCYELPKYIISRSKLHCYTGVLMFDDVPDCQIKDTVTHPDFVFKPKVCEEDPCA